MNEIQQYNQYSIQQFFALEDIKKRLQIALGQQSDIDRYIAGVVTTIVNGSDKLRKCSNLSIFRAILTAAQLRLDVDAKQHAYLVPFWSKNDNCYICTLIPGFRGYVSKIRQSDLINSIIVDVVYEGEKFEVIKGSDPKLVHIPYVYSPNYGDVNKITHFYVNLKTKTGENEFAILTRKQAEEIKNFVKNKNRGKESEFWRDHFEEMGKKSAIRRIQKMLQLDDTTLVNMNVIDNNLDDGKRSYIENGEVVIEDMDQIGNEVDMEMTKEKETMIEQVGIQFTELGCSNAEITNYCAKYLKVGVPGNAKLENLKLLSGELDRQIQGKRNAA